MKVSNRNPSHNPSRNATPNEVGGSKLVDGFYWDDTWTPDGVGDDPEPGMVQDMGLTKADLLQLTASYQATMNVLVNRTIAAGKFAWQLLSQRQVHATPPATCKSDLEGFCQPGALVQQEAMWYGASTVSETELASFLLIRGEYAWIGSGWQRCAQPKADAGGGYPFPPQLHTDFGTPMGLCAETNAGSGVFQREFSKATIKMDCNTGTPSIVMK